MNETFDNVKETIEEKPGKKQTIEEKQRLTNNPENLSREEILKKVGLLSNELFKGNHPSAPDLGLADGTFAGSGKLNVDDEGNVVLTRVVEDEDQLGKGWDNIGAQEMMDTSLYHGGGRALPTSGFDNWGDSFRGHWEDRMVAQFKIPVKDFLAMVKAGDAIVGNIGEGEIVLNPAAAKKYLATVRSEKGSNQ
jgi:hypothetical protein